MSEEDERTEGKLEERIDEFGHDNEDSSFDDDDRSSTIRRWWSTTQACLTSGEPACAEITGREKTGTKIRRVAD